MSEEQKNEEPKVGKGGKDYLKQFGKEVESRTYRQQAIFFLNAMWAEHSDMAEDIYKWHLKFEVLALDAGASEDASHDLNDFQAARFLEAMLEPMTVIERRNKLRDIDIDGNNRMGLLEFCVYYFKTDVKTLMTRPQGTNEEVKKAKKALDDVLKIIEDIEKEKQRLQDIIDVGSIVKSGRAKAELAKITSADNLPLNRAMITAEAAVRKAQKQGGKTSMGDIWFMEKELKEAKAYKPKGGIDKSRFSVSGR